MLQKILKISLWVLFAVTAVLVIMFYWKVVPLSDELAQMEHGVTNTILGWAFALFLICAVAAVVFPVVEFIKQLKDNPKSALKTIIMIAAIALVIVIAYAFARGDMDSISETLVKTNESELKWSDCGLITLYISLAISVLAVIYAEAAKKIN